MLAILFEVKPVCVIDHSIELSGKLIHVCVVPNQSIHRVRPLDDRSDRASDLHFVPAQVHSNILSLSADSVPPPSGCP